MAEVTAVILNGGRSRRMGQNKSQLKVNNHTFLEIVKKQLNHCSSVKEIYISGDEGIRDLHPQKGPLAGIYSALRTLYDHPLVLFIPVDMPLVKSECFKHLISHHKLQASFYRSCHFPLLLENSESLRKTLNEQIENNKLGVFKFLKTLEVQELETNQFDEMLKNINTPEEYQSLLVDLQNHDCDIV